HLVDRGDRNGIGDLGLRQPKKLAGCEGSRHGELKGMIEALRHDGDDGRKAALDLVGDRERQHKIFPAPLRMVGCRKDGAEIVARMAETAWGHVAVEKIDIANETGIVESGLIDGCRATADERTASARPIFLELIPERTKRGTWQRSNRATHTVEYISFQQRAYLGSQIRRIRIARECRDPLNGCALSIGVLHAHPFLLSLVSSAMVAEIVEHERYE